MKIVINQFVKEIEIGDYLTVNIDRGDMRKTIKKLTIKLDDQLLFVLEEHPDIKKKLIESHDQAMMSKMLATIITDAPVDLSLRDCKYSTYNLGQVKEVLEKYNFRSLVKRLGFDVGSSGGKSKKTEVPENQLSLL